MHNNQLTLSPRSVGKTCISDVHTVPTNSVLCVRACVCVCVCVCVDTRKGASKLSNVIRSSVWTHEREHLNCRMLSVVVSIKIREAACVSGSRCRFIFFLLFFPFLCVMSRHHSGVFEQGNHSYLGEERIRRYVEKIRRRGTVYTDAMCVNECRP